jgi:predicted nucleic acid-binding protein
MIFLTKPTCMLDANVLFPAPVRDYLLWLAVAELYKPKWTNKIQEEWISNLLIKRSDLKRKDLEKVPKSMNNALPDGNVENYEDIIEGLELPDVNDRHVLAAAIKAKADVIVTFNLKDFPAKYLERYNLTALHPDDFIFKLINTDWQTAEYALMLLD